MSVSPFQELADKADATAQGLRDLDTNVVQVMAKLAVSIK